MTLAAGIGAKFDRVAAIARAVLFEGYILYPYRPSSIKNRQRWAFGAVFPRDYAAHDPSERCAVQTQCLVRGGPRALVEVRARFLHLVAREVGRLAWPLAALPAGHEPPYARVGMIEAGGARFIAWEEAVERDVATASLALGELAMAPAHIAIAFPGSREVEPIAEGGSVVGMLIRTAACVAGEMIVAAEPVADGVFRVTARIENRTPIEAPQRVGREEAQRRAFASMHTILGVRDGAFVSLLDPPPELREIAANCDNQGAWPVLAGEEGASDIMLSSPIILYDYPRIAPESPGDLFDGTEIDEILTLRILTLTDEEKAEMAAVEPRVRALLERSESLTPAELSRLHGAFRPMPGEPPRPAAAPLGLRIGDRVRLHPKEGGDIMDIVLRDEVAVVEAIERDFEDRVHVAVTVLADPGRDLGTDRMPGHRFFFSLDEVEIIDATAAQ